MKKYYLVSELIFSTIFDSMCCVCKTNFTLKLIVSADEESGPASSPVTGAEYAERAVLLHDKWPLATAKHDHSRSRVSDNYIF